MADFDKYRPAGYEIISASSIQKLDDMVHRHLGMFGGTEFGVPSGPILIDADEFGGTTYHQAVTIWGEMEDPAE